MSREATGPERRRLRRFGAAIPAIVHTASGGDQGEIVSISKGGLFIRTLASVGDGEHVRVTFQMPAVCRLSREGDLRKIEVAGHVRWKSDGQSGAPGSKTGFGLQIDEWSEDFQEFFERMLFLEPNDAD